MTRYFTLIDDKSSKFWQIDIDDTNFTVTYGKLGTTGQSLIKTFDTTDRCQQEADKLIREKTGKGYVESVDGVAVVATPRPTTSRTRAESTDKQESEGVLNRYDAIIRETRTDEFLPFLQSVDKRHHEALRKQVKQAKRYWYEYVEFNVATQPNGSTHSRWGHRGSKDQQVLVNLSGLALLNHQELKGFDYAYSLVVGETQEIIARSILEWAKPRWLADYLYQQSGQGTWRVTPYTKLRELETAGLVDYHPELFARSITTFRSYLYYDYANDRVRQDHLQYIKFLVTDELVRTRELPTVFDYPTEIHLCTYETQDSATKQRVETQIWPIVFARLLDKGLIDRLWFFEQCLSVQTKDWNINLRAFFRKQFEETNPSSEELLSLQSVMVPLLAAQHPHVISWAIGLLKPIHTTPDFRVEELLEWAAAVMMRDDCKTALKTLLSMLERLAKDRPEHRPAIANLLADVFAINDLPLQTKAATLLIKYGNPTDADLQDRLQTYAGQMLGNVANDLHAFLTTDANADLPIDVDSSVSYQYAPSKPAQRLMPGLEVHLPATWNDFLFLIGKFISSDDPLDMEILMNALILPPADMPNDWREQLAVYEKKLRKTYFTSIAKRTMESYFFHWLSANNTHFDDSNRSNILTLRLPLYRLQQVDQKRKQGSKLPLLSLPSHAPHWIAPKVLIERLSAYQQQNEAIEPLDLAIAIARMPHEDTAEALLLCEQLDGNVALLMRYCLGEHNEITLVSSTALDRLLSIFGKDKTTIEQNALWAVAARTVGPDAEIPVFANSILASFPNVVRPFVPEYTFAEKWSEWKNYRTNEKERSPSWQELSLAFPTISKSHKAFQTLLYSNDLSSTDKDSWQYYSLQTTDILFWHSLIPEQPEALFTVLAKYGCKTSDESSPVADALHLMLQPGFQFREMSLLVLACGLLAKKRETGALAAEVLIHHFGEQTLDVNRLGDRLGWLLTNGYAPVQRLTDALNLVKDVSPLHNKALLLTLNALLAAFAPLTDTPKNTKKLLEIYLDLLVKLNETLTEATATTLRQWQHIGALKAISNSILKRV